MPLLKYSPAFAALALAACASTPEFNLSPAVDAPARYAAAPENVEAAASDWVAGFNDPQLTAFVEEALAANPTVASALANFEAAQASARSARSGLLPSLEASLGVSSTDRPSGSTTGYSSGLDASWQADIWGRLTDQARSGSLSAEAARADWYGARLTIAARAARAWYALTAAGEQTELSRRDVETRERQLEIVERRFRRGVARSSDVRTARSALASAEASLASRERAEASATRTLETTLGRYPAAAIAPADELPALSALPNPGAPEALLQRRPDIVAASARLAAAGFSADAARKALYPGLGFSASLSDSADDFGDTLDFDDLVSSISASILAPIFSGGRLRAERDRTAAVAEQLAASLVSTALTGLSEAENAIDADQQLAERVDALAVAAAEAQAALELVERQYASGVATIFELIDAQSRVISSQSQLIAARSDRVDNRIALHLAIAGDFSAGGGVTAGAAN